MNLTFSEEEEAFRQEVLKAKLAYHKDVDYSDKAEAEAPDTADRTTQTTAEQQDAINSPVRAAAVADTAVAATNAQDALASTMDDIAKGDLTSAAANVAKAKQYADEAAAAYAKTDGDPGAQEALRNAKEAEATAIEKYEQALLDAGIK